MHACYTGNHTSTASVPTTHTTSIGVWCITGTCNRYCACTAGVVAPVHAMYTYSVYV